MGNGVFVMAMLPGVAIFLVIGWGAFWLWKTRPTRDKHRGERMRLNPFYHIMDRNGIHMFTNEGAKRVQRAWKKLGVTSVVKKAMIGYWVVPSKH